MKHAVAWLTLSTVVITCSAPHLRQLQVTWERAMVAPASRETWKTWGRQRAHRYSEVVQVE